MPQAPPLQEPFLEPADAGRLVGLTGAGLNAAADRGHLPIAARTTRGTRLYRLADVQAFATRRRTGRVEAEASR